MANVPGLEFDNGYVERQAFLAANSDAVRTLASLISNAVSSPDFEYDVTRGRAIRYDPSGSPESQLAEVDPTIELGIRLLGHAARRGQITPPDHPLTFSCKYYMDNDSLRVAHELRARPNIQIIGSSVIHYGIERIIALTYDNEQPRDILWTRKPQLGLVMDVIEKTDPEHQQALTAFLEGNASNDDLSSAAALKQLAHRGGEVINDRFAELLQTHINTARLHKELGEDTFENVPPDMALQSLTAELEDAVGRDR